MARMIRSGRWRASRGHRVSALAAVFMLLIALAGNVLVSAGSPHHRPGAASAAGAGVADYMVDTTAARPSAHQHHAPNEWTPTPSKRLRPAATVTLLGVLPAGASVLALAERRESARAVPVLGAEPSILGVLRV